MKRRCLNHGLSGFLDSTDFKPNGESGGSVQQAFECERLTPKVDQEANLELIGIKILKSLSYVVVHVPSA